MSQYMAEPAVSEMSAPGVSRRGHRSKTTGTKNSTGRALLKWFLRLLVAGPAAYVSLGHVHETAHHFGQSGAMGWAEAVGMEAVSALALMELDEARHRRGGREGGLSLPWSLLFSAIALSLGSNVFAVLQEGGPSRSFGGVVYGGWPTLAFLAVAWLWHAEAEREATGAPAAVPGPAGGELADAGGELADAGRPDPAAYPTKGEGIRAVVLWELDTQKRVPKAADLAREAGVTVQYAGRVLDEVLRQPVAAP